MIYAEEYLNIPYLKLHFVAQVAEDCILPKNKVSGLRGGTGQMMIAQNCVLAAPERRDEDCVRCDCRSECLVQRFLYTPMEIEPVFSADKPSMGYVFECEDYREEFREGECFQFNVILFGKSRVYVNLLLQALYSLGMAGLGKHKGRFFLREITNSRKQPVLVETESGAQIIKERLAPQYLYEYVAYRKKQIFKELGTYGPYDLTLKFQTETAIKYQKELQEEFSAEAILSSIERRIYLLNCFTGMEMDHKAVSEELLANVPELGSQTVRRYYTRRFSTRQQSAMPIKGIAGTVELLDVSEELLDWILAGEICHIGKNISFGSGRYRVMV